MLRPWSYFVYCIVFFFVSWCCKGSPAPSVGVSVFAWVIQVALIRCAAPASGWTDGITRTPVIGFRGGKGPIKSACWRHCGEEGIPGSPLKLPRQPYSESSSFLVYCLVKVEVIWWSPRRIVKLFKLWLIFLFLVVNKYTDLRLNCWSGSSGCLNQV